MSTGPEHYLEAERLLKMYEDNSMPTSQDWAQFWGPQVLASAQAHATLALAAATARSTQSVSFGTAPEWRKVLVSGEEPSNE